MAAAATVSTYHGGVFGPRRPSPSHPLASSRQSYDRKLVEVMKLCRLSARGNAKAKSEWNVEPYAASETGESYYLDELDVVAFLDPPKELIPFDPSSYNPASYLWLVLLNASKVLVFGYSQLLFVALLRNKGKGKRKYCVRGNDD